MAVRRLAEQQPDSFAFTPDNLAWAQKEIAKYPEGRQASAVISLLWRAQVQEGWVSEPAISSISEMLDMPRIRVLEIATFYTMFHLAPVGKVAHVQVCGTTPCWLRGAENIKDVCRSRIHKDPHHLSEDGAFSWEEVECLGACVNAPLVQIGSDTYEDLTADSFNGMLDDLAAGRAIDPGPQIDRQFAAPEGGMTSLTEDPTVELGAAVAVAEKATVVEEAPPAPEPEPEPSEPEPVEDAPATEPAEAAPAGEPSEPQMLTAARDGKADDLKLISGVGPKLEGVLNGLGVYHFDQIASWSAAEIAWVDERLKFKGRIERDGWIDQAKILAEGGETEFSSRKNKS